MIAMGGGRDMTTPGDARLGTLESRNEFGEPVPIIKERLRTSVRARLETVHAESLASSASARIDDAVLRLPEVAGARGVLVCLSFGSEIDTWSMTDRILGSGRRVFVPRADPKDRQLHVHPYPCPLRTLSFGLSQPPRGTPELADAEIDRNVEVALVLGLAFDRRGYRLGHGSGYFDRFLSRHRIFSIGLTPSELLFEALPVEPHDLPMSVLVTEREVVRAANGPFTSPLPRP